MVEVDTFARSLIGTAMRDGDTFADATEVPTHATPLQRLVAFTGRNI